MPIKGYMLLTNIEQYRLFGKFPWIVVLHLILIALDSIWLIHLNNVSAAYIRR